MSPLIWCSCWGGPATDSTPQLSSRSAKKSKKRCARLKRRMRTKRGASEHLEIAMLQAPKIKRTLLLLRKVRLPCQTARPSNLAQKERKHLKSCSDPTWLVSSTRVCTRWCLLAFKSAMWTCVELCTGRLSWPAQQRWCPSSASACTNSFRREWRMWSRP